MSITVERLNDLDGWVACERLGLDTLGERAFRSLCAVPTLRAIHDSGGLILGAWDDAVPERALVGAVGDLAGTYKGFGSFFSLFAVTSRRHRTAGTASLLRRAERTAAVAAGVEVIRWWMDPLRGEEAHVGLNVLGAVGVSYERNVFGGLADRENAGLATDRVGVEWWLRSPRTAAILDEHRPVAHYRLELHQMAVITRTSLGPSGQRTLLDVDSAATGPHLLVEVPDQLDALRTASPDEARRWRLATRDAFERLFAQGYLLVGFVREAGRSFQLFEAADLGAVLGRSGVGDPRSGAGGPKKEEP